MRLKSKSKRVRSVNGYLLFARDMKTILASSVLCIIPLVIRKRRRIIYIRFFNQ
jgi:hypothetical protein